eukprot:3857603-Amphidinium_carterae.1
MSSQDLVAIKKKTGLSQSAELCFTFMESQDSKHSIISIFSTLEALKQGSMPFLSRNSSQTGFTRTCQQDNSSSNTQTGFKQFKNVNLDDELQIATANQVRGQLRNHLLLDMVYVTTFEDIKKKIINYNVLKQLMRSRAAIMVDMAIIIIIIIIINIIKIMHHMEIDQINVIHLLRSRQVKER